MCKFAVVAYDVQSRTRNAVQMLLKISKSSYSALADWYEANRTNGTIEVMLLIIFIFIGS